LLEGFEQAYGQHLRELVIGAALNLLPKDFKPIVAQQLQISTDDGQAIVATVIEITDTKVILDANHPLAGKDLTFEINLLSIESPL